MGSLPFEPAGVAQQLAERQSAAAASALAEATVGSETAAAAAKDAEEQAQH